MVGRLTEDTSVRSWWSSLGSETTERYGSQKAARNWLLKVPGVKQPAIGVASNFSTAQWPVFLEDIILTSARFSMQQWYKLAAEAFPRFSSDL